MTYEELEQQCAAVGLTPRQALALAGRKAGRQRIWAWSQGVDEIPAEVESVVVAWSLMPDAMRQAWCDRLSRRWPGWSLPPAIDPPRGRPRKKPSAA